MALTWIEGGIVGTTVIAPESHHPCCRKSTQPPMAQLCPMALPFNGLLEDWEKGSLNLRRRKELTGTVPKK